MTAYAFTWYGGELFERFEAPSHRCYLCDTALNYRDGRELCEATLTPVHPECHTDRCLYPACVRLVCSPDRCDDLAPCDWCGDATCTRHRPSTHRDCGVQLQSLAVQYCL